MANIGIWRFIRSSYIGVMEKKIASTYGHKLRVRVCGICVDKDKILLIKHKGIGDAGELWIPPGGGVDYLESTESALVREFKEETGLNVAVKQFLFCCEFIEQPLHAIELFFQVEIKGGELKKGFDPEHNKAEQIIEDVKFVTFEEIAVINKDKLHRSLWNLSDVESLLNMRGYFKFC